jgi:hypothetical protein
MRPRTPLVGLSPDFFAKGAARVVTVRVFLILIAAFVFFAGFGALDMANAHPSRIVLLRHGEKVPPNAPDRRQLCPIGALRAQALAEYYLGKGAQNARDIFGEGKEPDAFFAVTSHTQKTVEPSVATWSGSKPYVVFSGGNLGEETKKAAAELAKPKYDGKVVVIVWEHHHIADKQENDDGDTFWSLLQLGKIAPESVGKKWEGVNYDYFWVINYSVSPPTFLPVLQTYSDPKYATLPNNNWRVEVDPEKFPGFYAGCDHKGGS